MKWLVVFQIRQWYIIFATGIFLTVAMLSGTLQPIVQSTEIPGKPQPIFHGNIAEPKVAFACNIFWGEEFLPEMLQTFAKHDIKIT
ncbi:MAG TPA: polysaccharide deacetylase, partial [Negativicutes bacterium]